MVKGSIKGARVEGLGFRVEGWGSRLRVVWGLGGCSKAQRAPGTVMGHTSPNHNGNS